MKTPGTDHQEALAVGEPVSDLPWYTAPNRRFSLYDDAHSGRVTVVYTRASANAMGAEADLRAFEALHDRFLATDTQVLAVTADPPEETVRTTQRLQLHFPLLSDPGFLIGRAAGLAASEPRAGEPTVDLGAVTVILDPSLRVEEIIPQGKGDQAEAALAFCTKRAAKLQTGPMPLHAPVLVVPNLIDRDHCDRLIEFWKKGERYEGGVANRGLGGNVPVNEVKVREDTVLADLGPEAQELFAIFRRRLFPEIRKAFSFRVTRAETLRIGCYDAARGGRFIAHRDDTTPFTAHRRFAMSMNLNAGDYEGGELCFPEFGPGYYDPPAGSAVIFSCSLLHRANQVTQGRRFAIFGFFYSEAEEALRQKIRAQRAT